MKLVGLTGRQLEGRLFPYGKSGLKSAVPGQVGGRMPSLPVWEEWIEIQNIEGYRPLQSVSSRMGRVD